MPSTLVGDEVSSEKINKIANDAVAVQKVLKKSVGSLKDHKKQGHTVKGLAEGGSRLAQIEQYLNTLKAIFNTKKQGGLGLRVNPYDSRSFIYEHTPRNAYKISGSGAYGSLNVNLPMLKGHHRLIVKDESGKLLVNTPVDASTVDLLTKRLKNSGEYSPLAINVFRELTKISKLPMQRSSKKFGLLNSDGALSLMPYQSQEQLANKLELILGEIAGGNDSLAMANDGVSLIDELIKIGAITKSEYTTLFKELHPKNRKNVYDDYE